MCYKNWIMPDQKPEELQAYMNKEWYGPLLDYSFTMNEISRLISTFTEKHVRFKQDFPFRLKYRVVFVNQWTIHIIGEIYSAIGIWSDWKLRRVVRSVKFNIKDFVLLEDVLSAEIRNKKGNGGTLYMCLKKID